jgi:hypothetical protein
MLTLARLYFTESLATVLDKNTQTISINGGPSINLNATVNNRILLVASGLGGNTQLIPFVGPKMGANLSSVVLRYINACPNIPSVDIYNNDTSASNFVSSVPFTSSSGNLLYTYDQKISMFFVNPNHSSTFYFDTLIYQQINDILLPIGKNFSIIFTGDSIKNKTSVIIQQEY